MLRSFRTSGTRSSHSTRLRDPSSCRARSTRPGAVAIAPLTFPRQRITPSDIARARIPAAVRNRNSFVYHGVQRSIQLAALMNAIRIDAGLDKSAGRIDALIGSQVSGVPNSLMQSGFRAVFHHQRK